MTINFSCEVCGKTLSTSDDKAGRKAKCPGCGEMLIVPDPEGTTTGGPADFDDGSGAPPLPQQRAGRSTVACPMCGEKVSATADKCEFCGEPLEARTSRGTGHAIIDAGDVITSGWNCFKGEMGTAIGLVIVAGLLDAAARIPQAVCDGVGDLMMHQGERETALLMKGMSVLFLPLSLGVQFYIGNGLAMGLLKIARGEPVEIGVLFQGGKYFWRSVGAGLIYGIMVGLGCLLCIIPGIILGLMFGPFLYVLVDDDLPGIDCLWRAKEITEGNRLSYFVIIVACIGINLLGFLALCVGLIFTAPLTSVISAVAYCKMTGQRTAG